METIGFIGLGTMGAGMVSNLIKCGYSVVGFNRDKKRPKQLLV